MATTLCVPTRYTDSGTLPTHHIQADLVGSGVRFESLYSCTHLGRGSRICSGSVILKRDRVEVMHPQTEPALPSGLAEIANRR